MGVMQTGNEFRIEWAGLRAAYQGKIENGKLVGDWKQGPTGMPLTMERTTAEAVSAAKK